MTQQYLIELSYEIKSDKVLKALFFVNNTELTPYQILRRIMDEKGIHSSFHLTIPKKLDISDVELCTVTGIIDKCV